MGIETSPRFHQTPVDVGFQVHNLTPQLAGAKGIYSEWEEGRKKREPRRGRGGRKRERRGGERLHLTMSRGGDLGFVCNVVPVP